MRGWPSPPSSDCRVTGAVSWYHSMSHAIPAGFKFALADDRGEAKRSGRTNVVSPDGRLRTTSLGADLLRASGCLALAYSSTPALWNAQALYARSAPSSAA
jgi:hypothetical protein